MIRPLFHSIREISVHRYKEFMPKSSFINNELKYCKLKFYSGYWNFPHTDVKLPALSCRYIQNQLLRTYSSRSPCNVEEKIMSEKLKNENRLWTIPNLLCCARIGASPLLFYYILNSNYDNALAVLSLAGCSDFIDGQIARKFPSQASKIGTFLDPLADKILVISLFSALTYTEAVPGTLTMIIVFRDIVLLSAGFYIRYISLLPPKTVKKFFDGSQSSAELRPTYLSKINTVIQLFTAAVSLYAPNIPSLPHMVLESLWYTAGFTTILSGLSYAILRKKTYSISRRRE